MTGMTPTQGMKAKVDEAFVFHPQAISPLTHGPANDRRWEEGQVLYLVNQDDSVCPGFDTKKGRKGLGTYVLWWKLTPYTEREKHMKQLDVSKELKQVAELEAKLKELKETIEEKQNPKIGLGSVVRLTGCGDHKYNLRLIVQIDNDIQAIVLYGRGKGTSDGCYLSIETLKRGNAYAFVADSLEDYYMDH